MSVYHGNPGSINDIFAPYMTRIFGKFVLIIALLGQFILTPAMAMPSALMSLMHGGHMEMALDQGDMRLAHNMNPEMAPSTQASAKYETGMQMSHQGEPCKMSGDNSLVDCEALCAAMGPGDCMTHCASTLGNLSAAVPSLTIQPLSGPIVISGWSLQTADLTPLSPPPIG
ncbi:hypothetical protein K0I63_18300 [Shewanella rhizosphaerae]|uniref:hypothetical protein n=1 Tax=Shewanella rhizosphaerae TaxID=2864207 RepID=UPI001C65BD03|nr:hypothetical protein [Shewanella rhizosphaerae]QYK12649.1 hypothetical protein K0I63_18300 [Shewanella rhizosphaerae]